MEQYSCFARKLPAFTVILILVYLASLQLQPVITNTKVEGINAQVLGVEPDEKGTSTEQKNITEAAMGENSLQQQESSDTNKVNVKEPQEELTEASVNSSSRSIKIEDGIDDEIGNGAKNAALDKKADTDREQPALREKLTGASRGAQNQRNEQFLLPWFKTVDKLFKKGTEAKVTDIATGISFKVTRTYGYNHADVETPTPKDTAALKKLAGGAWNWGRRAVVIEVKGKKIAASINMMPHAGIDDEPANQMLELRSGDYGPGANLDSIKGNDMDGHICIHFFESRTHDSDKLDEQHQQMVAKANKWLLGK